MIYTKEPWEIQNGSTGPYIIAKDGNGKHVTVAQVFPRGVAGCETKGNAGLVKAAPKMYGKLKTLKTLLQDEGVKVLAQGLPNQVGLEVVFEGIDEVLAEVEGEENDGN